MKVGVKAMVSGVWCIINNYYLSSSINNYYIFYLFVMLLVCYVVLDDCATFVGVPIFFGSIFFFVSFDC